MLALLTSFAAVEGEKETHTLFYIFGIALVVYAVLLAGVGITRHESFPPSAGAGRALSLVLIVLVAGTMYAAATQS